MPARHIEKHIEQFLVNDNRMEELLTVAERYRTERIMSAKRYDPAELANRLGKGDAASLIRALIDLCQ